MNTRQIIDYAAADNAKEMRDALYADIHDRVMGHIDAKKIEVAHGIVHPQMATAEDTPVENT